MKLSYLKAGLYRGEVKEYNVKTSDRTGKTSVRFANQHVRGSAVQRGIRVIIHGNGEHQQMSIQLSE